MKKKDIFMISKENRIVIFGTGVISRKICRGLKQQGYNILCYLTSFSGASSTLDDIDVFDFQGLKEITKGNIDDITVVVCLQNGIIHSQNAKKIHSELGIDRILYLPNGTEQTYENRVTLRKRYTDLLHGIFDELIDIPIYRSDSNRFDFIYNNDRYISFWCPKDILYYYDHLDENGSVREKDEKELKQAECHISYFQMFEWIEKEEEYPRAYFNEKRVFQLIDDEEEYLNDRKRLFEQFCYALKYDMSMFVDSPIECELCEVPSLEGAFLTYGLRIVDGMHRACFLIRSGFDKIPVLISKDDYDCYINRCV